MSQQFSTLYGIPRNAKSVTLTRKSLGTLGELTVAREFTRMGFSSKRTITSKSGDVLVNVGGEKPVHVEVKTSRRGVNGEFKFCLYRKVGNRVCTSHEYADMVVLIGVEDDFTTWEWYIPAAELTQKNICISNPQTGKFLKYLRAQ